MNDLGEGQRDHGKVGAGADRGEETNDQAQRQSGEEAEDWEERKRQSRTAVGGGTHGVDRCEHADAEESRMPE